MLQDDTRLRTNAHEVAAKIVDGEAILIHLGSGLYYSLGGSGAVVWELLERGDASVASLCRDVSARYGIPDEEVRDPVRELARDLVAEHLVLAEEAAPSAAAGPPPPEPPGPDGASATFEAPRLVRYDDMAEIFALDPPLPELPPLDEPEST